MSCAGEGIAAESVTDAEAAAAFRRLAAHLQHRTDAANIDLMALAGFCRNCLADWVSEASAGRLTRDAAREAVYGMPYAAWKARNVGEATPEQIARLEASVARNARVEG